MSESGDGMAIAGIVLGWIFLALFAILLVIVVVAVNSWEPPARTASLRTISG